MSRRTKKSGSVARFGARYGVNVRGGIKAVEDKKNASYECPNCSYKKVRRINTSIWKCSHCGHTFAGSAYTPTKERR